MWLYTTKSQISGLINGHKADIRTYLITYVGLSTIYIICYHLVMVPLSMTLIDL